jgi:hypothetical protein
MVMLFELGSAAEELGQLLDRAPVAPEAGNDAVIVPTSDNARVYGSRGKHPQAVQIELPA